MRKTLIILPLLFVASPAVAQPAPQLPPELTDPATAQKLSNTAEALSDAVMSMRIGEVRAAVEGREATPDERRMTVGDLARRDDPDFDRHLHRKIASVGPRVQQSMRALDEALPAIMESLVQAKKSLERAVANMPDPTYPRR